MQTTLQPLRPGVALAGQVFGGFSRPRLPARELGAGGELLLSLQSTAPEEHHPKRSRAPVPLTIPREAGDGRILLGARAAAPARVTPLAGKADGWMNRQRDPRSLNPPPLGEGLARIYRGILAAVGALRPAKEPPSAPGDAGAACPVPPKQFAGRRGSRPAPAGKRWHGPSAGDTSPRGTCLAGLGQCRDGDPGPAPATGFPTPVTYLEAAPGSSDQGSAAAAAGSGCGYHCPSIRAASPHGRKRNNSVGGFRVAGCNHPLGVRPGGKD